MTRNRAVPAGLEGTGLDIAACWQRGRVDSQWPMALAWRAFFPRSDGLMHLPLEPNSR